MNWNRTVLREAGRNIDYLAIHHYYGRREMRGDRLNLMARPLFLMTRSCAVLDLAALGPDEAILFCPANHSVPTRVVPYPGAPGYEAVATCLAPPEVRARTEGIIAMRPPQVA